MMLVMARTSIYPLADRLVGGDLADRLKAWRAEGRSYAWIVATLDREFAITVTRDTVTRWCKGHIGAPTP
jgi:hypothetical protein